MFIDTQVRCLVLVRSSSPWTLLCGVLYDELLGVGRKKLKQVRMSNLLFSSLSLNLQFSRERSSVCLRKCQRPPPASVLRVLGQNSYRSKGSRCLIRKIGNSALLLQIVISGSVRTQRERTRRFLFNASCLIFFYYCVQRFFYTKKLNAVLIKCVASIGGSSKSEDFVRNKCKLFWVFLILWNCWFFVSAMKSYSLTVSR